MMTCLATPILQWVWIYELGVQVIVKYKKTHDDMLSNTGSGYMSWEYTLSSRTRRPRMIYLSRGTYHSVVFASAVSGVSRGSKNQTAAQV